MSQNNTPNRPKKSMAMRIIVLFVVVAMFAGFIILPLLHA